MYFKPMMAKSKDVDKMKKETKDMMPHEFMGPFAWAFCFPFDEEGVGGVGGVGELVLTELRPLRVFIFYFLFFIFYFLFFIFVLFCFVLFCFILFSLIFILFIYYCRHYSYFLFSYLFSFFFNHSLSTKKTPLTDEMIFEALEKEDKKEKTKFIRGQVDFHFSVVDDLVVPSLYTPTFVFILSSLYKAKTNKEKI